MALAAFLALITCAIASHWAVWRRLGECEIRVKALETHSLWQAKQIAGLQVAKSRPQPGLTPTGVPTKLQLAVEEAIRLRPADPASYIATNYPKRPDEL